MASGTKLAVVGIGALFIGALVGGVIGASFATPVITARPAEATGARPVTPGAAAQTGLPSDARLLLALDDLATEVGGLREAFEQRASTPASTRTSPGGGTPELERLAELLEVLATSLKTLPRAGTGPGFQGAPLVVPRGEPRRDRLADVAELPQEDRSRDLRFLTYQQVLDRFGHPDEVTQNGVWLYFDPDTEKISLEFRFHDGLVTNVY